MKYKLIFILINYREVIKILIFKKSIIKIILKFIVLLVESIKNF